MKIKKQIKKQLKVDNQWVAYKHKFAHRQMKFVVSHIAYIFNENVDVSSLIQIEKSLINIPLKEDMFVNAFLSFAQLTNTHADWETFAKFLYYVYQTSTYWKDDKKGITNVYTHDNYNTINETKRKLYNSWWKSIKDIDDEFNLKLMKVLRRVY